jgi:hypothetical protein
MQSLCRSLISKLYSFARRCIQDLHRSPAVTIGRSYGLCLERHAERAAVEQHERRHEVGEFAESSRATAPGLDLRRRCGPFRAACSSALDANGRAGASHANATSRKEAALFAVASCAANLGTYLYDYTPPRKHSAVPTTGTMLAAAGSTKFCQASNHCTRLLFDTRYHLG